MNQTRHKERTRTKKRFGAHQLIAGSDCNLVYFINSIKLKTNKKPGKQKLPGRLWQQKEKNGSGSGGGGGGGGGRLISPRIPFSFWSFCSASLPLKLQSVG